MDFIHSFDCVRLVLVVYLILFIVGIFTNWRTSNTSRDLLEKNNFAIYSYKPMQIAYVILGLILAAGACLNIFTPGRSPDSLIFSLLGVCLFGLLLICSVSDLIDQKPRIKIGRNGLHIYMSLTKKEIVISWSDIKDARIIQTRTRSPYIILSPQDHAKSRAKRWPVLYLNFLATNAEQLCEEINSRAKQFTL